ISSMLFTPFYPQIRLKNQKESALIATEKASAIKQEKPPVNVVTLALTPTSIYDRINLPGFIEPWTSLQLLAKSRGTVTEVFLREGSRVKQGDIIAKIEDDDYRIARDRSSAAYTLAKAEYDRDKKLYAKGMIPIADLDAKKTRMETAKADLEDAQLQYSRCTIIAPMDGVIRTLNAKVGLLLSVADPIAEILKIDQLKAVIGIPESDVNAVRKLDSVELTIQALGNEKITGHIHFLSPSPETIARIYNLEVKIDNSDGRIFPGMFVRADIVKNTMDNSIVVPFYSVISRNDEQFVFVEKDGTAEKRNVSLGIMEKWMVEITEGLQPGDRLIIEGHRDVENMQKIKVVKAVNSPGELTL
ncbi:MAG TPA: efflux RND transporter periplasmic adaptor subunit, partial [Desulfobacterales bacterium]|nr:efflux RND transporter periplasmic adaptor subunit [Desulfobacterales bacterium]